MTAQERINKAIADIQALHAIDTANMTSASFNAMNSMVDEWPIDRLSFNPWNGLQVWDGELRYECQRIPEISNSGFLCGKCIGKLPTPKPLNAPGDVCEGCFSLALEKSSMASISEQYLHGVRFAKDAFVFMWPSP